MNGQAGNPLVLLSLISNGRRRLYAVHAMFATNQLLSLEVYVIAPINGGPNVMGVGVLDYH